MAKSRLNNFCTDNKKLDALRTEPRSERAMRAKKRAARASERERRQPTGKGGRELEPRMRRHSRRVYNTLYAWRVHVGALCVIIQRYTCHGQIIPAYLRTRHYCEAERKYKRPSFGRETYRTVYTFFKFIQHMRSCTIS